MTTDHAETGTADSVVREALEALLSIGCWGLHDSKRAEVWTLAMRARRMLDGNPMSDGEAEAFRELMPKRLGGGGAERSDLTEAQRQLLNRELLRQASKELSHA